MNRNNNDQNIELFLENYFSEKNHYKLKDIDIRQKLTSVVQWLIDHDFPKFIQFLYQIDVSEQSLRTKLRNLPIEQSTDTIVDIIIQRLEQKRESRKLYQPNKDDIDEADRW